MYHISARLCRSHGSSVLSVSPSPSDGPMRSFQILAPRPFARMDWLLDCPPFSDSSTLVWLFCPQGARVPLGWSKAEEVGCKARPRCGAGARCGARLGCRAGEGCRAGVQYRAGEECGAGEGCTARSGWARARAEIQRVDGTSTGGLQAHLWEGQSECKGEERVRVSLQQEDDTSAVFGNPLSHSPPEGGGPGRRHSGGAGGCWRGVEPAGGAQALGPGLEQPLGGRDGCGAKRASELQTTHFRDGVRGGETFGEGVDTGVAAGSVDRLEKTFRQLNMGSKDCIPFAALRKEPQAPSDANLDICASPAGAEDRLAEGRGGGALGRSGGSRGRLVSDWRGSPPRGPAQGLKQRLAGRDGCKLDLRSEVENAHFCDGVRGGEPFEDPGVAAGLEQRLGRRDGCDARLASELQNAPLCRFHVRGGGPLENGGDTGVAAEWALSNKTKNRLAHAYHGNTMPKDKGCNMGIEDFKDAPLKGSYLDADAKCRVCGVLAGQHEPRQQASSSGPCMRVERNSKGSKVAESSLGPKGAALELLQAALHTSIVLADEREPARSSGIPPAAWALLGKTRNRLAHVYNGNSSAAEGWEAKKHEAIQFSQPRHRPYLDELPAEKFKHWSTELPDDEKGGMIETLLKIPIPQPPPAPSPGPAGPGMTNETTSLLAELKLGNEK
eukprot:Cvel_19689.t1-p1 / transcript=Cvel_19689.t1 / gene=Cvel_19689 / organism=Chromera_velia_CCMP2878 / gene_product=hypothetical protein / transcript_product=hypothetical protein / location=Cvel_scaffold1718:1-6612(-) / protein_length=668 / sequence_SO=supercontig / SO=protein_coding / is_pseudo=false